REEDVPWPGVAATAANLLENQHYLRQPLDERFSQRALERYFEQLDPEHLIFLQTDLAEFRGLFSDSFASRLKSGNLDAIQVVEKRHQERLKTYATTALGLAGGEWDFSTPWNVDLMRDHAPWPADESEARQLWVAQIGAELLEYRLAGSEPAQALAQVRKRLEQLNKSLVRQTPKEQLAPALLALARAADAHSDYLTQEELEDTESELRLSRVGIGVTLEQDPQGLRVVGLLPGGPAQKDGRLRVNDRIVAVSEEGKAFRDLEGLPFAQSVSLLRGKKGTLVRLKIAPSRSSDRAQRLILGLHREEMRSRDGEAYAKIVESNIKEGKASQRFGWIVVPGFYGDDAGLLGRRSSSVSKDVGLLLNRLQAEKVDGIVLDFRGNLGGLLDEAVEIGGLFCGRVPIAQVNASDAETEVLLPERLRSSKPVYTGPLIVLTDRGSASASELVAGALQDYGRALVVGGEQTFGKGSVQTTLPLKEFVKTKTKLPLGGMAISVGKFYRVNGQSTQLKGVRPDIVLPSTLDLPNEGEAALTDPLPHDAVVPVAGIKAAPLPGKLIQTLRTRAQTRVDSSSAFASIVAERDQARKERLGNQLSLEEKVRREALETARRSHAEREARSDSHPSGVRFCRVLLEDLKTKQLRTSETDPLGSLDPESVAIEAEVLRILGDFLATDDAPQYVHHN
ncbi:MAG: carboxy terminal-processing peptidase, partial [Verrucomicrobiota bacterium]